MILEFGYRFRSKSYYKYYTNLACGLRLELAKVVVG